MKNECCDDSRRVGADDCGLSWDRLEKLEMVAQNQTEVVVSGVVRVILLFFAG